MSIGNPALEKLLKQKLTNAPALKDDANRIKLPPVEAPSLEGLEVDVTIPDTLDEDAFDYELWHTLRAHATCTDREPGATIGEDDEVLVDLVGYYQGDVLPHSTARRHWLTDINDDELPGLRDALTGAKVGESRAVEVVYDDEYPVELLRGLRVAYAVDIQGAREVKLPSVADKAFLKKLGLMSPDALSEKIALAVADEVERHAYEAGERLIMEELGRRVNATIPEELVTAEVTRRYNLTEGEVLRDKGASVEEQDAVLAAWLEDEELRDEVVDMYRTALALGAINLKYDLEPTREDFDAFVAATAHASQVTEAEVKQAWKADESVLEELDTLLRRSKAINYVLAHAQVNLIAADG